MFTRVEVRNFRSLKDVKVSLSNFHVLVGPNGSGKTTFLDVFAFMRDLLDKGIYEAINDRVNSWEELRYSIRYAIQLSKNNGLARIEYEECHLFNSSSPPIQWRTNSYPSMPDLLSDIAHRVNENAFLDPNVKAFAIIHRYGSTCLITDTYTYRMAELTLKEDSFSLNNIPEDIQRYPVTTWLKDQFKRFIQPIVLSSDAINKAGKEGRPRVVTPDGSNLPWLIDSLKKKYPERYKLWLRHVKTALPEIASIKTVKREDQEDMFLKIKYKEGQEIKSWMVSDGTLRFLLLTILPYHSDLQGLFLIEEPEIGIHPQAIEPIMESLRSLYDSQALVVTHSTAVVNCVKKEDLLVFSKNPAGETIIVAGSEHPRLKDWKGSIGSAAFFSTGVSG
jgi:predicted ATPase